MKTVSPVAPRAELRAALLTTLGDLLRLHAPHATLLACVGDQTARVRAGEAAQLLSGDLVPPDDWLERGEMTWITQGGALLGLLHSEASTEGQGVLVDMLTLLLTSARASEAPGDTELLISQLPVPAAWLSTDLSVQSVSRALLEWFGWTETEVLGQRLPDVWPGRNALPGLLEQAAAGRSLHLPDAPLTTRQGERWVRGEARPYFGSGAAGVLLTLQDVSGEYAQAARVSALMDSEAPTALLGPDGHVLHASAGLLELLPLTAPAVPGAPLWAWPCFADVPSSVVQDLFTVARSGGAARADVPLAQGGVLPLSVRRTSLPDLLVAEGLPAARVGQAPAGLLGQVLALTDSTAVALDHVGRVQFVSDSAAELLGLEVGRLLGLSLTRVMADLGVQVLRPDGEAQPIPDWRTLPLPLTHEVLLGLPSGKMRHMQLRATALPAEGSGKPGLLLTLRDFTALRRAQAKMRHDARHDALTGLLNRSGLNDALTRGTGLTGGEGRAGAVVALTPRKFGELVAALGRTACDHLLIQVAARLNDVALDEGGAAARLNDTTLAAFLPGRSAQEALERVQKVLKDPLRAGRRDIPVQFALGGTECAGADIQGGTVISDAEVAMQHALRQLDTPEQASVFRPALRAQMAQAFELEDALREAVGGEQLTLLYQPAIRLTDGRPMGAEALLRWNHPKLGLLGPGQFLGAAARTDLIGQVGDWVVRAALRGRTEIREALPEPYGAWRVGVNLNLQELRRSAGLRELLPLLSAQGAPDIEVTAGSLLDHSQETLGLLEQLRSLGAALSVDDFGDTATNLAALTRFPLDGVKLHPTLTARLPEDPRSVTLVQATVDLAHRLGLWVTAVGVETPEQLRVLRELGCNAAQGYAIAPPLALPELLDWLRQGEQSAVSAPNTPPAPTRKPRAKRTKRE